MPTKLIAQIYSVLFFICFSLIAQSETIIDVGSCGRWVNPESPAIKARNDGYLTGYLSGKAIGRNQDVLEGFDAPSLFLWMDNYCKANPLNKIVDGADALYNELLYKTKPRR